MEQNKSESEKYADTLLNKIADLSDKLLSKTAKERNDWFTDPSAGDPETSELLANNELDDDEAGDAGTGILFMQEAQSPLNPELAKINFDDVFIPAVEAAESERPVENSDVDLAFEKASKMYDEFKRDVLSEDTSKRNMTAGISSISESYNALDYMVQKYNETKHKLIEKGFRFESGAPKDLKPLRKGAAYENATSSIKKHADGDDGIPKGFQPFDPKKSNGHKVGANISALRKLNRIQTDINMLKEGLSTNSVDTSSGQQKLDNIFAELNRIQESDVEFSDDVLGLLTSTWSAAEGVAESFGLQVSASVRLVARMVRAAYTLGIKRAASDGMYVEEAHAPKEEKNMEEELKEDKKENPFGGSDKKEDKKEEKSEDKKEDKKEEKSDKPGDKSLDKSQKDALEGAFDAMKTCGDPACKEAMDTLKSAFPFLGKEDKKEDKLGADLGADLGGDLGADIPGMDEDLPELGDAKDAEPAGDLGGPADIKPFAGLVATLKKQASVGDSVWVITDAKTNQEFASFNIKAAFGEHINADKARAAYATSKKFGRDVIASLVANKAHDVMSATAAVLQVAAHYSPEWAGAKPYKDNPESSHAKASGEGDVTTDKNLISDGKEAKAAAKASLTKKASEYNVPGVTDNGEIPSDSLLLDGADKRSEKVSNNTEESAHAKNSTKVEEETDRKLVASYEAQIKRQASENAALAKQIETLKTEAAIKEKSAKVKECVALMCNKGFIKADENVRVASLKEGLSIEAANGRAMAASIDKQAKYLFGMNSTQLDAYMNSLKGVSTPAFTSTASAGQSALTIKASSTSENETDRLLKLFGWD